VLPQIVLGERALRQLSYRTFASVAPTMPPSAESLVTRTPSTPGAGPAESAENFSRREEAKLSFAAPSVAFESCETGWTVYIFTSFPLNGSHLPEKMLVSSRSSHSMRKTSSFTFAGVPLGDFNREATLRCVDIFTETIWIEAGILLGIDLQSS